MILRYLEEEFGFHFQGLGLDTLIAAHTMYCELPKGLDFLASLHTDVPYYSDYQSSVDEELWTYNCYDACVTYQLADLFRGDLSSRSTSSRQSGFTSLTFLENHIQPAMQVMTRVGQRGVLVDTKVRDDLKLRYTEEMLSYEKKLQDLAGPVVVTTKKKGVASEKTDPEINPGLDPTHPVSSLPEARVSHKMLNPKTHQPTADEAALKKLRAKFP